MSYEPKEVVHFSASNKDSYCHQSNVFTMHEDVIFFCGYWVAYCCLQLFAHLESKAPQRKGLFSLGWYKASIILKYRGGILICAMDIWSQMGLKISKV